MTTAVAAMGMVGGLALAPSTASASEVGIQGCQAESKRLIYVYYTNAGGTANWEKTCSGNYPLSSYGYRLYAGNWSGYITTEYGRGSFCNWDVINLSSQWVTRIEMSPTKLPECVF
ncbi:hypothetical protein ACFY4C_39805 [Actinomadura viridis]|uniref:hypothetical protein n=1 Tax=Actinomadura viridis TaxID=58110 RepID=UPI0036B0EBA2